MRQLWSEEKYVEAWAKYWAELYSFIHNQLIRNEDLNKATCILRYEDLCSSPSETVERLLNHCELNGSGDELLNGLARPEPPTYYKPSFSESEMKTISDLTGPVAKLFGY